MPDTVVIGLVSCFGMVLSFRRDISGTTGIRNGMQTACMWLLRDIPCSLHVAGKLLSMKYSYQPRSCRPCGGADHFGNDCKQPHCYNCDLPGHRAMECEESVLFGVCFRSTHPLSECPFVVLNANVVAGSKDLPASAKATKDGHSTKKSCSERTPEQQEAICLATEASAKRQAKKEAQAQEKEREK